MSHQISYQQGHGAFSQITSLIKVGDTKTSIIKKIGAPLHQPWPAQPKKLIYTYQHTHHKKIYIRHLTLTFDAQDQGSYVEILEHNFAISYGSIILGLMEAWIIPLALGDMTGLPVPLEELLRTYIPCDRINESVGLAPDSMICDTVLVTAVSTLLRNQIIGLDFDEGAVKMSGRFVPVDLDSNRSVEKLDEYNSLNIENDFTKKFVTFFVESKRGITR